MSTDRYLTIALGKGRLAKKAMELFEKIGITCEEMKDPASRKLIFVNEEQKLRFFLSKGPDVPTYVEYGAADIGIVGKDTILEENRRVYEVLDLGFGKCRMCVCGPKSIAVQNPQPLRQAAVELFGQARPVGVLGHLKVQQLAVAGLAHRQRQHDGDDGVGMEALGVHMNVRLCQF